MGHWKVSSGQNTIHKHVSEFLTIGTIVDELGRGCMGVCQKMVSRQQTIQVVFEFMQKGIHSLYVGKRSLSENIF